MNKIIRTKVIEEIVGYQAFDGEIFNSKSMCEAHEMEIAEEKLMKLVVGETNESVLFGNGLDDDILYIVAINTEADMEVAELFNSVFSDKKYPIFRESDLGKEVIIKNYDPYEYYRRGTLDDIINDIKIEYEGAKKYYAEEKRE